MGVDFWFLIAAFCACYLVLWRSQRVGDYRRRLYMEIFAISLREIENGVDYTWRWRVMDTVSFNQMVYKFWKPLDSFYPDHRFHQGESE